METVVSTTVLPEENELLLRMARKYARRDAGPAQIPAHRFDDMAKALAKVSDEARRGIVGLVEVASISDREPRPKDPFMAGTLVAIVNGGHPAFISFTGPNQRGMHTATLHAIIAS